MSYEDQPTRPAFLGGTKFDETKTPLQLLDPNWLCDVAEVLKAGATKYGAHNWRKGIAFSRLYGAILRHLFAWAIGEDDDSETGRSHLDHAACELMFLKCLSSVPDMAAKLDDQRKA